MNVSKYHYEFPKLVAAILLLSLASGLIGCTPAAPEPTPIPASATPLPPTAIPPPTLTPTETPVPTATETPFVPKATFKIAVHVPLSGDQATFGTDILRAAELAAQQLALPINELGYKIELVSYDDQADIEVAIANAKELVADPEILCGVGHFNSRVMIQASEIYHKEGLAFVSPSNTSATVTDRGYLEVNRVVGRDDGQGIAAAHFAKAQNFAAVYIVYQSSDFARRNADNFKREADRTGVKVVGMLNSDATEDFSGVIQRMMNTNPELVYFAGFAGQAGPLIRQARAAGYSRAFLLIDDNPALADLAGPLMVDGDGTYYISIAVPASVYPDAGQFVNDFDNHYGAVPQLYAAQAFDAAGLCMKAIEEAAQAKGGELPTRNEVANAIRALQDYKGITGTYTFNQKGDPLLVKYYVVKVVAVESGNWNQNTVVAAIEAESPK